MKQLQQRTHMFRPFNNLLDEFFQPATSFQPTAFARTNIPVNVRKSESGFILEIVAPGFDKTDFRIHLEQQLLEVSTAIRPAEAPATTENDEKYIRKEFVKNNFKKAFTLPETVDSENISAQYVNGVLTLNLPVKQTVRVSAKKIEIA